METLQELLSKHRLTEAGPSPSSPTDVVDVNRPERPIARVDQVFRRWLGLGYDVDALHIVLSVAAGERLPGDPAWLLYLSGSGHAKTETVQALSGGGALVTSTITSEGSLLSATSRKERTTQANGGLLRRIGDRGTLVVKDVTSILGMARDPRSAVLAALREVYDGYWERNVGTDGGQALAWRGRLVVIGACTTAWDTHQQVIATLGDRFLLVRTSSRAERVAAGRQAIRNSGSETTMRRDLAEAVAELLAAVDVADVRPTAREEESLLQAANLVTLTRTAVETDIHGEVIEAHEPEAPTRFAKQLTMVFRGAIAIGFDRHEALRLALRCARDSMPPLRLVILQDLAAFPNAPTRDVRKRLDRPWRTVDRQLQALHALQLVTCDESEGTHQYSGKPTTTWRYTLAAGIDPDVLMAPAVPVQSRAEMSGDIHPLLGGSGGSDFSARPFPKENAQNGKGDLLEI